MIPWPDLGVQKSAGNSEGNHGKRICLDSMPFVDTCMLVSVHSFYVVRSEKHWDRAVGSRFIASSQLGRCHAPGDMLSIFRFL